MSGPEECFLWLDVDENRAALPCVGATAPFLLGGEAAAFGQARGAWRLLPEG